MGSTRIVGIVLVAAGILGSVFTNFSYTKEEHQAKLGPIELSVKERETVSIPAWASAAAIVVGAALVFVGGKKG